MKLGFGIPVIGPAVSSAVGLSAYCRGLEDLGYDSLWVADRLVTPVAPRTPYSGEQQPFPPQMTRNLDPVLLWTVAAAATSRVRLNASTLSTFYYEPPHLARLLTTLDVLSDGRLEVGVGLGWMRDEHDIARCADWHRRGKMLDDLLAFLHAWWTADVVSCARSTPACARSRWAGRPSGSVVPARPRCAALAAAASAGWRSRGCRTLPSATCGRLRVARPRTPAVIPTRFAESGTDEAFVDAFAAFPSLDQTLDFASHLIARAGRL